MRLASAIPVIKSTYTSSTGICHSTSLTQAFGLALSSIHFHGVLEGRNRKPTSINGEFESVRCSWTVKSASRLAWNVINWVIWRANHDEHSPSPRALNLYRSDARSLCDFQTPKTSRALTNVSAWLVKGDAAHPPKIKGPHSVCYVKRSGAQIHLPNCVHRFDKLGKTYKLVTLLPTCSLFRPM